MSELAATAERLRTVKDACLDFMTLWALDQLMAENAISDRLQGDILSLCEENHTKSLGFVHRLENFDD